MCEGQKSSGNAWDTEYYGGITAKVTNSDGTLAYPKTYTAGELELITTNKSIDSDLKDVSKYGTTYTDAFAAEEAGFQLNGATYTAFAAEGGSYVIEGKVTDDSTGKVLSARCTVTVEELGKDAWVANPEDASLAIYAPNPFDPDEDDLDKITGLTEAEYDKLPLITSETYGKYKAKTVKKGERTTNGELAEKYATYTAPTGASDNGAIALATATGATVTAYEILDNAATVLLVASPEDKADKKTIYQFTITNKEAEGFNPEKITPGKNGWSAATTLSDSVLFKTVPVWSPTTVIGKDAYNDEAALVSFPVGKGMPTEYKVEMDTALTYVSDSSGEAKLTATMGGKFAGYVRENGQIGNGYVVADDNSKIINSAAFGRPVEIQTYFGTEVVGEVATGVSTLYGIGADKREGNAREKAPAKGTVKTALLEQDFYTVSDADVMDYFTDSKDQLIYDDDYARVGTYKVVFSYWTILATKAVEKSAAFSVKNDLYVPKVTVKGQYLDSYSQDGWKDVVVSEVGLNNNVPAMYSVTDLLDKDGNTISDDKTPAKWAIVYEEGTFFHIPLNRTFKLS